MAWSNSQEAGYEFQTLGPSRRLPVEYDGLYFVSFYPPGKAAL
jgi:CRISPR-associated protein Cas2